MPPDVSVVIATYNRAGPLARCLAHLAGQSLGRDRFEVIVASDGSTDGTPEQARAEAGRLGLDLRVVETSHGGPGHARNAGVAAARAEVLAFTDDDTRPDPGWLAAGLRGFADDGVGGVEGRTEPDPESETYYRQGKNIANTRGGLYPTCNMFYRRRVFVALGGFDERFARAREDADLAFRVLDLGLRIVFAADAGILHRTHKTSLLVPLVLAAQFQDSVLLWWKHPGRDRARARFYASDVAKLGLAAAAATAAALGAAAVTVLAAVAFLLLVARTLRAEVDVSRVGGPGRVVALFGVYALLPFAHLHYGLKGCLRTVRLGLVLARPKPAAAGVSPAPAPPLPDPSGDLGRRQG